MFRTEKTSKAAESRTAAGAAGIRAPKTMAGTAGIRARRAAATVAAIALVVSLAAGLSGCGAGTESVNGKGPALKGVIEARESFPRGEQLSYVYDNGLDWSYETLELGDVSGDHVKISGHPDPAVEKKVNDLILSTAIKLASDTQIPPYVGAAVEFRDMIQAKRNVYTQIHGSFNGLLSVSVTAYQDMLPEDPNQISFKSYSQVETLNIDLRTGEQIALKDLFKDGIDGIAYLNSYMDGYISEHNCYDDVSWDWNNSFYLRDEFRGVDENQKFVIDSWNGQIRLYFDYGDPEVQTEFYPVFVAVDDNSYLDYGKFMKGSKLVSESSPVRLLEIEVPLTGTDEMPEPYSFSGRRINYSADYACTDILTDEQMKYFLERTPEETALAGEAIKAYDRLVKTAGMLNVDGGFYEEATVSQTGPYRIVRRSSSYYISDTKGYGGYANDYAERICIFKEDSSEPLRIEDFFKPGTDWKSAVKDACREKLTSSEYVQVSDPESYMDEMLERMDRFLVSSDGLQLYYKDRSDIDSKYLSDPSMEWAASSALNYVTYKDLGADKLDLI